MLFVSLCQLHLLNAAGISLSAGVGRSGTFVALLWLMQLCVRGIMPDVRAAVEDLRRHRVMMVQNLVSPQLLRILMIS
jgi:protein tyrosine phosphatase